MSKIINYIITPIMISFLFGVIIKKVANINGSILLGLIGGVLISVLLVLNCWKDKLPKGEKENE